MADGDYCLTDVNGTRNTKQFIGHWSMEILADRLWVLRSIVERERAQISS